MTKKVKDAAELAAIRDKALEELDDIYDAEPATDSMKRMSHDVKRIATAVYSRRITANDGNEMMHFMELRAAEYFGNKKTPGVFRGLL